MMASSAAATSSVEPPLRSRPSRLCDSEAIGVSEFIISCASTRAMSSQAVSETASRSPASRCNETSRCGASSGVVNCEAAASRRVPFASCTMRCVPGGSALSCATASVPSEGSCARRGAASPSRRCAARFTRSMLPSARTTMRPAGTVSSNACRCSPSWRRRCRSCRNCCSVRSYASRSEAGMALRCTGVSSALADSASRKRSVARLSCATKRARSATTTAPHSDTTSAVA